MAENLLTEWTFANECEVPKDALDLLIDGETVICSYKTIRDVAIMTNKRFIVVDSQGITGKKKEIYTLPYSSIVMYSSENAGMLDINSEIELWTKAGKIKLNFSTKADIRKFDRVLANAIL